MFGKVALARENQRLLDENQRLREERTALLQYKKRMEQEWKNWWEYNGMPQKEDADA